MKNVESINDVRLIQRLEEHTGVVNSLAFYGNHLIASGSGLVGIIIWFMIKLPMFMHICKTYILFI